MCKRNCGQAGTYQLKDGSYTCAKSSNSCPTVKKKKRQTCLRNYGVEYPAQSDEVTNKRRQTCLKNYGVEYPAQSEIVQSRIKNTNLERYGVERPAQSEIVQSRIKNTNLERYGVEHGLQNEEIRAKIDATVKERYGVDNISQNQKVKKKKTQTLLKNYGIKSVLELPNVHKKALQTRINNGNAIPLNEKPLFKQYTVHVNRFTNDAWQNDHSKINPKGFQRSYNEYHLDHIVSKFEGYQNNIPPYIIGHWTNLQMLPRRINQQKRESSGKTIDQLFEDYFNYFP